MARHEGKNDCGDWDSDGNFYAPVIKPYVRSERPRTPPPEKDPVDWASSGNYAMTRLPGPNARQIAQMHGIPPAAIGGFTGEDLLDMSTMEPAKVRARIFGESETRARARRNDAMAAAGFGRGDCGTLPPTPQSPRDHPKPVVIHTGFGDVEIACYPNAAPIDKWRWCRDKFVETGEQRFMEALLSFVQEDMVGFDDDNEKAPVLAVQPAGRMRLALSRVRTLGRRLLAWLRH